MIKDQPFRRLFIPVAGICFPFLAGLAHRQNETPIRLLLAVLFFTAVTLLAWNTVVRTVSFIRKLDRWHTKVFRKLLELVAASGLCAALVFFLASLAWLSIGNDSYTLTTLLRATAIGGLAGMLLASVYEAFFLTVERELDTRVLQQIDKERQEAEVSVLKNELDPHFFFNCMNTLLHLVSENDKARRFVHKLSSIYKYFLQNKASDCVPLRDELAFLEDYCYLLRIRFDNSIRVENTVDADAEGVCILPCTLQVLVENAMKHNSFSEKEPLIVSIGMNDYFITVQNPVKPKLQPVDSTNTGLKNLKARYRLITNQNVLVQRGANKFLVKLPIVKKSNNDKNSDH